MSRRFARSAALLWCTGAFVACATYDGLPTQMNNLGDAGGSASGKNASDGGSSTAGTGDTASAGKLTVAGQGGGVGGDTVVMPDGGAAGIESGAGAGGLAGVESGGAAGKAGSAGSSGGGTGGAGGGGAAGTAGSAGSAGSGGTGGAAPCSSKSPDASCTCVANDGHDYWFCTKYLTFAAAETKCTAVGMHLPKVETQAEDNFIYGTSVIKVLGEIYLGGTDAAMQDTWVWTQGGQFWKGVANGTVTGYAHWNANEPNASGDCVVVQGNGGAWDDRICTDGRKFVCEAPP